MKKFLSLVLALVMAMSLVTISAGATEYKELTDKDEIQYEEAVAVLNRIGIITGYDDGSFQPKKELTRGAAAKIIVSLLIGPEAAGNLPNNSSPYPDVPANHTFAGVISFCKTKNIISGYGDGTFKPGNTLTGYAFAKMLLGAVGYNADIERFTGSGWTNNVAAIGQSAGLFDRLKFDGSAAVNREQACQLALNALKATVVTYTSGINVNVTGADTNVQVTSDQVRSYKTSNQEFARNIRTRNYTEVASSDNYYTVEFAEEHFVDLRLEHDKWNPTEDDFGRPSAEWSYKKVTIGTYPLEADFSYNTQVAHDDVSNATKERALGLKGYELHEDNEKTNSTVLWVNGNKIKDAFESVADIADYTDNGTVVEVYVSENDADYITDVVVVHTQLMEIKRISADYVSLDTIGQDNKKNSDTGALKLEGFNQPALSVEVQNVRDTEDDVYKTLSAMKAGDEVAIIPVTADNGRTYTVSRAYAPETVTGKLSKVTTYAAVSKTPAAIDITVGDTTYKIADWNKGMYDLDADKIKITRKDVTLVLDEFGNALRAKDVGETDDYMVISTFSQSLSNGKIVWTADGWDGKGNALSLNVGTSDPRNEGFYPGDLVHYTSKDVRNNAEWKLETGHTGRVYDIDLDTDAAVQYLATENAGNSYAGAAFNSNGDATAGFTTSYTIKASNVRVALTGVDDDTNADGFRDDGSRYLVRDPKFIYVEQEENGSDVDTIEFFTGAQKVTTQELFQKFSGSGNNSTHRAQAYVNKDGYVECVVIKTQSNNALSTNLLYVKNYIGTHEYKEVNGVKYYGYVVAMATENGFEDPVEIYSTKKLDRGDFATYTKATDENAPNPDSFYTLKEYTSQKKTTSVAIATDVEVLTNIIFGGNDKDSKDLLRLGHVYEMDGTTVAATNISKNTQVLDGIGHTSEVNVVRVLKNANWVDVTRQQYGIDSIDELEDYTNVKLALVFNDNETSDGFRTVSMVVVVEATSTKNNAAVPTATLTSAELGAIGATHNVDKNAVVTLSAPDYRTNSKFGTVTYQWEKSANGTSGWAAIAGATEPNYTVPTAAAGATYYRVVIVNRDSSKPEQKTATSTSAAVGIIVSAKEAGEKTVALKLNGLAAMLAGQNAPITSDGNIDVKVGDTLQLSAKNVAAGKVAKVTVTETAADGTVTTRPITAIDGVFYITVTENMTKIEIEEEAAPLPADVVEVTFNLINAQVELTDANGVAKVLLPAGTDNTVQLRKGAVALKLSAVSSIDDSEFTVEGATVSGAVGANTTIVVNDTTETVTIKNAAKKYAVAVALGTAPANDWTMSNLTGLDADGKAAKGAQISFTLTQNTPSALAANATVTLTGAPAGATGEVTTAGSVLTGTGNNGAVEEYTLTGANDASKTAEIQGKVASAPAGQTFYMHASATQVANAEEVPADFEYVTTNHSTYKFFYLVDAVAGEITVTFTVGTAAIDATITGIATN